MICNSGFLLTKKIKELVVGPSSCDNNQPTLPKSNLNVRKSSPLSSSLSSSLIEPLPSSCRPVNDTTASPPSLKFRLNSNRPSVETPTTPKPFIFRPRCEGRGEDGFQSDSPISDILNNAGSNSSISYTGSNPSLSQSPSKSQYHNPLSLRSRGSPLLLVRSRKKNNAKLKKHDDLAIRSDTESKLLVGIAQKGGLPNEKTKEGEGMCASDDLKSCHGEMRGEKKGEPKSSFQGRLAVYAQVDASTRKINGNLESILPPNYFDGHHSKVKRNAIYYQEDVGAELRKTSAHGKKYMEVSVNASGNVATKISQRLPRFAESKKLALFSASVCNADQRSSQQEEEFSFGSYIESADDVAHSTSEKKCLSSPDISESSYDGKGRMKKKKKPCSDFGMKSHVSDIPSHFDVSSKQHRNNSNALFQLIQDSYCQSQQLHRSDGISCFQTQNLLQEEHVSIKSRKSTSQNDALQSNSSYPSSKSFSLDRHSKVKKFSCIPKISQKRSMTVQKNISSPKYYDVVLSPKTKPRCHSPQKYYYSQSESIPYSSHATAGETLNDLCSSMPVEIFLNYPCEKQKAVAESAPERFPDIAGNFKNSLAEETIPSMISGVPVSPSSVDRAKEADICSIAMRNLSIGSPSLSFSGSSSLNSSADSPKSFSRRPHGEQEKSSQLKEQEIPMDKLTEHSKSDGLSAGGENLCGRAASSEKEYRSSAAGHDNKSPTFDESLDCNKNSSDSSRANANSAEAIGKISIGLKETSVIENSHSILSMEKTFQNPVGNNFSFKKKKASFISTSVEGMFLIPRFVA